MQNILKDLGLNFKMSIRKEIHTDFNINLENIWNEFEINNYSYCFQNFYWLKNWYFKLKEENKPAIYNFLIFQNDKLLMILPLCVIKKNNTKILSWQGGDRADFMCGLFSRNFSLKKNEFLNIWNEILKKIEEYDIIYLYKQPKKIEKLNNPFTEFLKCVPNNYASSIILENNYDLFLEKNIKSKFISDTNRRINKLKKEGEIKFEIYNNYEKDNLNLKVKLLLNEKIKRLQALKLKNPFNSEARNFYESFDDKLFKNGLIHFSNLLINNKIISSHWGIVHKKKFYHLLPTILDNSYYKFSPGRIHIQELIKWSIKNNLEKFDFTIGPEDYKKDWINNEELLYSYLKLKNFSKFFYYVSSYFRVILKKVFLKK